VTEAWVANASPLILLGRIGRLDLMERLAPEIIVPDAVIAEIRAGELKDATAITALRWAESRRVADAIVPATVERWDLGSGESQVIAYGLAGARWVVLDDFAARRCATAHGITVIGTLGIVLRSKQRGSIDRAKPWITKLLNAGMFVDHELLDRILAIAGE
jgi:predicted nucleic acid-binding protein